MSPLDQIRQSIEARIAECHDEIARLQLARAQLQRTRAGDSAPTASGAKDFKPQRRQTAKPSTNGRGGAGAQDTGRAAGLWRATAPPEPADAPGQPRRQARPRPVKSERRVEVLPAGKLEAMLAQAEDGLSAVTISKRASASYSQVLALLRELESTGQVRRSGARRTSLWRLITEEERIAERAAELHRLAKSSG